LGGGYRRFGFINAGAVQLETAIGVLTRTGAWYGIVGTDLGSTAHGLLFGGLMTLGAQWEAPAGPAHLGLGLRLTPGTVFRRFTAPDIDDAIGETSASVAGSVMFDVAKSDTLALVLGVQGSAGIMGAKGEDARFVPGVTGVIGVRLF